MDGHHAQLIRTSVKDPKQLLQAYCGKGDEEFELQVRVTQSLTIGEVHQIIADASLRPEQGAYRLLMVIADSINTEAQQALLKILEEPPATTRFFFALPHHAQLLSTVLSRFSVLTDDTKSSIVETRTFQDFVGLSFAERQEVITKRLAKKDTAWVEEIKTGLAAYIASQGYQSLTASKVLELIMLKLATRGASNKMLLEALAFTIPSGQGK